MIQVWNLTVRSPLHCCPSSDPQRHQAYWRTQFETQFFTPGTLASHFDIISFFANYHTIGVLIKVQIIYKSLDYSVSVIQTLLHWWEKEQVFGVAVCLAHSGGLRFGNLHFTAFVIQTVVLKWKSVLFVVLWLVPLGGQLDLIFNLQPCTLHKTIKNLTRNYTMFHFVASLLDLDANHHPVISFFSRFDKSESIITVLKI